MGPNPKLPHCASEENTGRYPRPGSNGIHPAESAEPQASLATLATSESNEEVRPVSIVAPIQRRPWVAIAVTVALALAVTIAAAVMLQPGRRLLSRGGTAVEEKVPEVPQARWKFDTGPAGGIGKLTKQQTTALRRQRGPLRAMVKSVYGALFIDPSTLPAVLRSNFAPGAARSFRRAQAGIAVAGTVKTTYRGAEISMQPLDGVRRAVATVAVRAAEVDGERRMLHQATLWFERPANRWKVVAFDVSQSPIELSAQPEDDSSKKKNQRRDGKGKKG